MRRPQNLKTYFEIAYLLIIWKKKSYFTLKIAYLLSDVKTNQIIVAFLENLNFTDNWACYNF